jgi:hypothetical protein
LPQPRQISVVAVRTDPLRVVVAAEAPLAHGDVRGTRIRLTGAVADALADLRRTAQLGVATPLVGLLDARPDPGAVPGRSARAGDQVPHIFRSERLAYERAAREAGFTPVGVMAIPDAVTRRPATPTVRYSGGRRAGRRDLPAGGDLLLTAAVAALRGELRRDQPEADEVDGPVEWAVESVAGAGW